jgi:hypothetical protein
LRPDNRSNRQSNSLAFFAFDISFLRHKTISSTYYIIAIPPGII